MNKEYQNKKFTELRFEYYVSGRTLWFNDTMSIGAMLLGYAIEAHLKHGLAEKEVRAPRDVLYNHDLPVLFDLCKSNHIFSDVEVSDDLLIYASDMLHQRYPSQSLASIKRAEERGHAISMNISLIAAYDDLLIQLDNSIAKQIKDEQVSIGILASHFVNRPQGRAFFHSNIAALRNLDHYLQIIEAEYLDAEAKMRKTGMDDMTIKYNLLNHEQRLATWRKAPASIWCNTKWPAPLKLEYKSS